MAISISSASAHGVGGLEPSKTKASVKSIVPKTDFFKAESIENGDRFKVTRTSNEDVIVLGVDDEPYILINERGTFINSKSATGLINKSATSDYSKTVSKSDFEKTSIDPNQIPEWERTNSSQSYAWHDHRTHYMGSVPSGVTDLGTSSLKIKSGNETFVVNLSFTASGKSLNIVPLVFLFISVIAIAGFALGKKTLFNRIMNRKLVTALLLIIFAFEIIHVWGYIAFSQNDFWEEATSTMYSIALISLSGLTAYRLLKNSSAKNPWDQEIEKKAPLISITAFVGIFVGAVFEYKTFTYPYLPTIYSPEIAQLLVSTIALCSVALFILGIQNVKASKNTSETLQVSQD